MISVSEATSIIQQHLFKPGKEKMALAKATGRILAESIIADRDFPPFHRASMDGIAIQHQAFAKGQRHFTVEGLLPAGAPSFPLKNTDAAIEIMTGAMLPVNTDTVVRYEDVEITHGNAHITIDTLTKGEGTHPQAQDAAQNDVLLAPGIKIAPAEIALMASVGKADVLVYTFPKTAIISTGNELVAVEATPLPHQIRRSNSYALQSALSLLGCEASLFHVPDEKHVLEKELKEIVAAHELIILSGGVSKGKFDFIPEVLTSLGIEKKFHQVSQRPGKPFWFGTSTSSQHTVFALPGNPVSTYMCYYRYIQPWLLQSMHLPAGEQQAILARDFSFKPPLTYFLQVKTVNESGKLMAYPDAGGGSGDFANLKNVSGFLELPEERTEFKEGEALAYYAFR